MRPYGRRDWKYTISIILVFYWIYNANDCVTFAHRTSAHHDFVTSAHQNWDICSPPSGHLLTKIWDICSPKSGHLLTKFLKFCNPIIKSESVPPGHVKGYIYGCGGGGGPRRLRRRPTPTWRGSTTSLRASTLISSLICSSKNVLLFILLI